MLEEELKRNTAALVALTAAIGSKGGAAKPEGTKAESTETTGAKPSGKKAPAATVKSVSDLVLSLVELQQRTAVVSLLKQHGATKVKDIAKSKLAALQKKLMAVLAKTKSEKDEPEEEIDDVDFDDVLDDLEEEDDELDFLT